MTTYRVTTISPFSIFSAIFNAAIKKGMEDLVREARQPDEEAVRQEVELELKNQNGIHDGFLPGPEALRVGTTIFIHFDCMLR